MSTLFFPSIYFYLVPSSAFGRICNFKNLEFNESARTYSTPVRPTYLITEPWSWFMMPHKSQHTFDIHFRLEFTFTIFYFRHISLTYFYSNRFLFLLSFKKWIGPNLNVWVGQNLIWQPRNLVFNVIARKEIIYFMFDLSVDVTTQFPQTLKSNKEKLFLKNSKIQKIKQRVAQNFNFCTTRNW